MLPPAEFVQSLLSEAERTHPWLHHRVFHLIWDGTLSREDEVAHARVMGQTLSLLAEWQASGAIRKDVNVETLARAIHCLNVGYFLTRYVFAPDGKWDDKVEFDWMADILVHGASSEATGSP